MPILQKIRQHCRFYIKYGGVLCISIEKLSYKRPLASFYSLWNFKYQKSGLMRQDKRNKIFSTFSVCDRFQVFWSCGQRSARRTIHCSKHLPLDDEWLVLLLFGQHPCLSTVQQDLADQGLIDNESYKILEWQ
jgi:hypothetical protein